MVHEKNSIQTIPIRIEKTMESAKIKSTNREWRTQKWIRNVVAKRQVIFFQGKVKLEKPGGGNKNGCVTHSQRPSQFFDNENDRKNEKECSVFVNKNMNVE